MLQQLISSGKAPARKLAHARILLKIDRSTPGPEWTDEQAVGSSHRYLRRPERPLLGAVQLDDCPSPWSSSPARPTCPAGVQAPSDTIATHEPHA